MTKRGKHLSAHVSSAFPGSFGMVLTKGHGKLVFIGNVSVEEGMASNNALLHRCFINCGVLMVNVCCLQVCMISPPQTSVLPRSGKLTSLIRPTSRTNASVGLQVSLSTRC